MVRPVKIMLLGATQGVAYGLIRCLSRLSQVHALEVHIVSRRRNHEHFSVASSVFCHVHDLSKGPVPFACDILVSLGPINFVEDQARAYIDKPPKAIWVLSSVSPDFKSQSSDQAEHDLMEQIGVAERKLDAFCRLNSIHLQIFKTTMLYGRGDQNVNRLIQLMSWLPWVPTFGNGLRAPIHVDDIAKLMCQCIDRWCNGATTPSGIWCLKGGEVLSYPQMLQRIAKVKGLKSRFVSSPYPLGHIMLSVFHKLGYMQDISTEMLKRQGQDLIVDDSSARRDLAWRPRPFQP